MEKRLSLICLIAWLAFSIVGCGMLQKKNSEEKEVDYTVVKKEELPSEVKKIIEVKKQEEFQMAYQCEGELYLLRGYGIQSSGGYSIQVEYVRENEEEIHIKTRLLGPESREEQKDTISCPSIVVKVENRNKKIVFD